MYLIICIANNERRLELVLTVDRQLNTMLAEKDVAMNDAQAEIRRTLENIQRGIAATALDVQEVTHRQERKRSDGLGVCDGRK